MIRSLLRRWACPPVQKTTPMAKCCLFWRDQPERYWLHRVRIHGEGQA